MPMPAVRPSLSAWVAMPVMTSETACERQQSCKEDVCLNYAWLPPCFCWFGSVPLLHVSEWNRSCDLYNKQVILIQTPSSTQHIVTWLMIISLRLRYTVAPSVRNNCRVLTNWRCEAVNCCHVHVCTIISTFGKSSAKSTCTQNKNKSSVQTA